MYSSTETLNFQAPEDALSNVLSEFYADADEVLASIQRRGVPMTLREPRKFKDGRDREPTKPYAQSTVQHMVQKLHKDIGLPTTSRSMLAGTVEC